MHSLCLSRLTVKEKLEELKEKGRRRQAVTDRNSEELPCFFCSKRKVKEPKQPVKEKEKKKNCDWFMLFVWWIPIQLERILTGWERRRRNSDSLNSSEVGSELADQLDLLVQQSNPIEMPLRPSTGLAAKRRIDYHVDQEVKDHVDWA